MDAQRAIARRMVIGLPERLSPAWEKDFAAYPPAGVIIFRRDFRDLEDLRRLTARLRDRARPRRLFLAMDEEGGWVSQLSGHLVVPPNALVLGRGATPGEIEWISRITAERLRALGVDWVFAPVADIRSEPRNPVIGPRAFGADPALVSLRVGEAIRGFRAGGVSSCLKHFPGHGDTVLDSHLALPSCASDPDRLEERELRPFRDHLDADAVMTAHVVYPALDPHGPATFSHAIVGDLLRSRLGFAGIVITDALEMKGASAGRGRLETAELALEAGCDLLLFAHHDDQLRRLRLELARSLVEERIERSTLDEARPRLARLDRERPAPGEADLARPLEALTPPDWERRLEAIVERGLLVSGSLPAAAPGGAWRVVEPEPGSGPSLRSELERLSLPLSDRQCTVAVEAVMSRLPLSGDEIERLRAVCRERPTVLVGLQNDAFLDDLPEAAVRISAADHTALTRRVVARALAALHARACEARV